jgi:hypothetical protein
MINLETSAPASPPLRSLYVRQPQDPFTTVITLGRRSTDIDDLVFILETLWDKQEVHNFGLSDILDQLEHLALDDPSQKSRLSTLVSDVISDLGLLAQARDELEGYQPWAAGMDYEFAKVHVKLENSVFEEFNVRQVIDSNMKFASTGLAPLGSPLYLGERRFHYPSDKRRTRETTEAMQLAEQNLDQFWARFDAKYQSKVGKTINQLVEGFLVEKRNLQRTPDWVEPEAKPKKSTPESLTAVQNSFSSLGLSSTESPSPYVFSAPKSKVKTRGVATTSDADVAEPGSTPHEDVQPTLYVDRRAHKVFKALFFSPKSVDLPGETP